MAYLPQKVVSWRYQRGQRSLMANLEKSGVAGASTANAEMAVGRGGGAALDGEEDDDGNAKTSPPCLLLPPSKDLCLLQV